MNEQQLKEALILNEMLTREEIANGNLKRVRELVFHKIEILKCLVELLSDKKAA